MLERGSHIRPDRLFDAYVFDLDGTIYLGDQLLPGVAATLGVLRERLIPVRFLSNNPTKDPRQYAAKLAALGVPTPIGDIANTIVTTVGWLREHHPDAVIFPIAEEPLVRALTEAGFRLSDDPAEIDVVIASYDRTFDYRKLQIAFDALWLHQRAILVQTNPDRFCPFPGGRGEPDCAAITAAIEACTQVKCSASFGKPGPIMIGQALNGLRSDPRMWSWSVTGLPPTSPWGAPRTWPRLWSSPATAPETTLMYCLELSNPSSCSRPWMDFSLTTFGARTVVGLLPD